MTFSSLLLLAVTAAPIHVVLDPGHGGPDSGVISRGLSEKTVALQLARRIETKLAEMPGVLVLLTRKGDYALSFDERRRVANSHEPGLFLSLHFSAAPDPLQKGVRIYLLGPLPPKKEEILIPIEQAHQASYKESRRLGERLADSFRSTSPDTILKISPYPVSSLLGIRVPAVLIEFDYLTASDASRWRDPATLDRAAELTVAALERFWQSDTEVKR